MNHRHSRRVIASQRTRPLRVNPISGEAHRCEQVVLHGCSSFAEVQVDARSPIECFEQREKGLRLATEPVEGLDVPLDPSGSRYRPHRSLGRGGLLAQSVLRTSLRCADRFEGEAIATFDLYLKISDVGFLFGLRCK